MGLPVTTVASGGLPIVETTRGTPVTEAANLRGVPVTKIVGKPYGLPVTFESIGLGPAETPDPFFANVVFLAGFEGTNGSTSFVDESPLARVLTGIGDAKIDTSQFKFGTSSAAINQAAGSTGRIQSSTPADFNFGNSPYTIEGWVRFSNTTGQQTFCGKYEIAVNSAFMFYLSATGKLTMSIVTTTDGTGYAVISGTGDGSWAPASGVWYYVGVSFNGSVYRLRIDGVMVTRAVTAPLLNNSTRKFTLGNTETTAGESFPFKGWFEEWRVTKLTDRYNTDANIPVPTTRFPRS